MRFGHDKRFILISNWKCGCTSIAHLFAPVSEYTWETRHRCAEIFGYEYRLVVHWPAKFVFQLFRHKGWNPEDYITISSVRNPWDRMVSMYFNLKPDMSFRDFIVNELPNLNSGKINYWNTYEMFHDDNGRELVNSIIRIEHLQQDLQPLVEKHFPGLEVDYTVRKNTTKHVHYSHYYDDETRQAVENYAKYEIERWGYCFEEEKVKM